MHNPTTQQFHNFQQLHTNQPNNSTPSKLFKMNPRDEKVICNVIQECPKVIQFLDPKFKTPTVWFCFAIYCKMIYGFLKSSFHDDATCDDTDIDVYIYSYPNIIKFIDVKFIKCVKFTEYLYITRRCFFNYEFIEKTFDDEMKKRFMHMSKCLFIAEDKLISQIKKPSITFCKKMIKQNTGPKLCKFYDSIDFSRFDNPDYAQKSILSFTLVKTVVAFFTEFKSKYYSFYDFIFTKDEKKRCITFGQEFLNSDSTSFDIYTLAKVFFENLYKEYRKEMQLPEKVPMDEILQRYMHIVKHLKVDLEEAINQKEIIEILYKPTSSEHNLHKKRLYEAKMKTINHKISNLEEQINTTQSKIDKCKLAV